MLKWGNFNQHTFPSNILCNALSHSQLVRASVGVLNGTCVPNKYRIRLNLFLFLDNSNVNTPYNMMDGISVVVCVHVAYAYVSNYIDIYM